MTRVLLFCVKLALLVGAAVWLANRPGEVSIQWFGYRLDTTVGILLLAAVLLAGVAALIYRVWSFITHAPREIGRGVQAGRRKRGYKALTQGMVAVAAGEVEEASRWARKAGGLLDDPPLTMLLSAQAAQLSGDEAAAKRYFTAMLEDPETRFLGLRGLLTQALREGDDAAALDYVRQAHGIRPRTPWVLTSLFDLSQRRGDLETAERALKEAARIKALPAPEAARRHAVLTLERALARHKQGDGVRALKMARAALKLAPDLTPAALLEAELLTAAGQGRKAARALEQAWTIAPHPALARLYHAVRPGKDGIERLKYLGKLTAGQPDHAESQLALARAALEARLWGEARRHLAIAAGTDGLEGNPGEAVCRLMAELEEAERDDSDAARAWLRRAAGAPAGPAWVCRSCGAVAEDWSARCGACGEFDGLAWQRPPRVAPAVLELTTEDTAPEPAPGTSGETPAATLPAVTAPAPPPPMKSTDAA